MKNQNLAQVLGESLKNWLSSENQKWHQQQKQLISQQQEQIAYSAQIFVQDALGQVLQSTNILPNLTKIENSKELIPYGYQFGETSIYAYKWMKKSSDKISSTLLRVAKDKINDAIDVETRRLNMVYQNLSIQEQSFFIQQYPAFYTGFRVVDIKDSGTDAIIFVAYN